jgi:hypothetical protein
MGKSHKTLFLCSLEPFFFIKIQKWYRNPNFLGMHWISGRPDSRPDNRAFFISGIRPDTGFALPNIQSDTGY